MHRLPQARRPDRTGAGRGHLPLLDRPVWLLDVEEPPDVRIDQGEPGQRSGELPALVTLLSLITTPSSYQLTDCLTNGVIRLTS